MQKSSTFNLAQLKRGQRAKVVSLSSSKDEFRQRLIDMGITKGVDVEIKQIAPLGDPISIGLRGYELCLRKSDLRNILVEVCL